MHAIYYSATGTFLIRDRYNDTLREAVGYAGYGDAANNPSLSHMRNVGPLPPGAYELGAPRADKRLGPTSFPLQQVWGPSFGRSGFYIHGDNGARDRSASSGCIVLARPDREAIRDLGVSLLIVDDTIP